jgi:hypothetical protein
MLDKKELFPLIRRIVAHIDTFRKEPNFTAELLARQHRVVAPLVSNAEVLRNLAQIIAFAHANSSRVKAMIDGSKYDAIWLDYDVDKVAALNPCDVVEEHWEATLSPIMNGGKAYFIVMAARAIQRVGAVATLFNDCGIPARLYNSDDIDAFWTGFAKLHKQMKQHGIPYLSSITSLSHLLLHLGYDCVKPDAIVMGVAQKLSIVAETKKDTSLKKVARTLQEYALEHGIRPSEIDMYFLIQGRQSDAMNWVSDDFIPEYRLDKLPTVDERSLFESPVAHSSQ